MIDIAGEHQIKGRQTRGWSACADHDGRESEAWQLEVLTHRRLQYRRTTTWMAGTTPGHDGERVDRPGTKGRQGWRLASLILLPLLLSFFLATVAFAVEPSEMLKDPVLEARARSISRELRCLVCQNQSIDESNADLAHDLRLIVRERLTAGDSDDQVKAYLVARYGDFVLLDPPFKAKTLLLWCGPGAAAAARCRRHLRLAAAPAGQRARASERGRAEPPRRADGGERRGAGGRPGVRPRMMLLWVLAALLCLGVVALLALPLLSRRAAAGMDHPDLAVYRDQLAELEREVARGLLPETEAASARLEIERRLLAAAGAKGVAAKGGRDPRRRAGLVSALACSSCCCRRRRWRSTSMSARPIFPPLPFADRTSRLHLQSNQQMAAATAQLEAR